MASYLVGTIGINFLTSSCAGFHSRGWSITLCRWLSGRGRFSNDLIIARLRVEEVSNEQQAECLIKFDLAPVSSTT